MLRLPATQIELGQRDLTWHTQRSRERIARHKGLGAPKTSSVTDLKAHYAEHYPRLPLNCLRPGLAAESNYGFDESIVSDEPVPRDSRTFWDDILANVGSPRAVPPIAKQLIKGQDSISQTLSRPSEFSDSSKSSHDRLGDLTRRISKDDLQVRENYGSCGPNDSYEQFLGEPHLASQFSSDTSQSTEAEFDEVLVNQQNQKEDSPKPAVKHYRSLFRFYQRSRKEIEDEEISQVESQFSRQLDLDGSMDTLPDHLRQSIKGSVSHGDANLTSHRHGVQVRLDSPTQLIESNMQYQSDTPQSSSFLSEPEDQSNTPPPPVPRSLDRLRSQSGVFAPSPLYISQAAASSSPERRVRSNHSSLSEHAPEESSLIPCIPRRPKRYKARSRSYSYVDSEDLQDLTNSLDEDAELEGLYALYEANMPNYLTPSPPSPSENSLAHYTTATGTQTTKSLYQTHRRPPPPRQSSLNSISSLHSLSSLNLSSSPILPPPFSTTPRVHTRGPPNTPYAQSITRPLPPAPPSSPDPLALPIPTTFRAPHYNQKPLYRQISSSSSTLPPPTTPHRSMRIYNDTLPASSQPQTPADLTRYGTSIIGAMTEPVGRRRRWGSARTAEEIDGIGSPRRRGDRSAEQENVGVDGERWWVEVQGEERERRSQNRGAELDRTPPREDGRRGGG